MSTSRHPLPAFLSDLSFTLGGKTLQAFPMKDQPELLLLALEPEENPYTGLLIQPAAEFAEQKCSQALTRYSGGRTTTYTAWDDETPDSYEAAPFQDWVRAKLIEEIQRMVCWHLEELLEGGAVRCDRASLLELCGELAALPAPVFTQTPRGLMISMLALLPGLVKRGSCEPAEEASLQAAADLRAEDLTSYERDLLELCLEISFTLLDSLPAALTRALEERGDALLHPLSASEGPSELAVLSQVGRRLARSPSLLRELVHPRLLEHCSTGPQAHVLFVELKSHPREAERYLLHGLSLPQESLSLLIAAETFYLGDPEQAQRLAELRARIDAMGVKPRSPAPAQDWIDRYTQLANDFRYYRPKTRPEETGPELLDLEEKLNQHWLSLVPEPASLMREPVERELTQQSRFLSAGSASYVGWLRNRQRYQEAVDHLLPLAGQGELCRLRQRSNRRGFEALLNNGLGCFLDSQREEHVEQALELMDALEAVLSPWESGDLLYQLACVAARGGQQERALRYAQLAVERGESYHVMSRDSDLESLWGLAAFEQLEGA